MPEVRTRRISNDQFVEWLMANIARKGWNKAELSRQLGVVKGTVNKWALPNDHPRMMWPSYKSATRLAEAFDTPLHVVLELIGLDHEVTMDRMTPMQRDVVSLVGRVPDEFLLPIRAQLRALTDRQVQAEIRAEMERVAKEDH